MNPPWRLIQTLGDERISQRGSKTSSRSSAETKVISRDDSICVTRCPSYPSARCFEVRSVVDCVTGKEYCSTDPAWLCQAMRVNSSEAGTTV